MLQVCQYRKLYLIYEHFNTKYMHIFFVAAMLPNHFQSPYILFVLACILEAVTQD